jgi:hypothetical protein
MSEAAYGSNYPFLFLKEKLNKQIIPQYSKEKTVSSKPQSKPSNEALVIFLVIPWPLNGVISSSGFSVNGLSIMIS